MYHEDNWCAHSLQQNLLKAGTTEIPHSDSGNQREKDSIGMMVSPWVRSMQHSTLHEHILHYSVECMPAVAEKTCCCCCESSYQSTAAISKPIRGGKKIINIKGVEN